MCLNQSLCLAALHQQARWYRGLLRLAGVGFYYSTIWMVTRVSLTSFPKIAQRILEDFILVSKVRAWGVDGM
jgi:hypothetical protein